MDKFSIKINGVPLLPNVYGDIIEVVVDTNAFQPGMFTILINDTPTIAGQPLLTHTDNLILFRIGAKVTISSSIQNNPNPIPTTKELFSGQITAIEPMFREDGQIQLRIRGYDAAHKLTLGKKTRAWGTGLLPTVTEMQIVTTIAGDNGLTPMIDPTGVASLLYEYVIQYNQSDWDFLWARARICGYQLYVDGSTLRFVQAGIPRNAVPTSLTWGENLLTFKPRFVAAGAVTGVQAHGYNPALKKGISGKSIPGSANLDPTASPAVAKGVLGSVAIKTGFSSSAVDHVVSSSITNVAAAIVLAKARFLEHESHYVRASGEASGEPNLVAGSNALITNVGTRFAGTYFVTQAIHIFRSGDYRVEFEVSGRNPFTFGHLTGQDPEITTINGAVIGIVTDINDPMLEGRMKVKFPWMPEGSAGEMSSGWARMASLGGGKNGGIFFTPEVNDEVLVIFEQGNVNYPYIVGVLWNKGDKPPKAPTGTPVLGGQVNQRIIKSKSGHIVVFDDTPGKEKITLQDKNDNGIEIDSVMNKMTIKTKGDLIFEVGGKFVMNSQLDMTLESKAKGSIKVISKLDIEAQSGATLKAGTSQLDLTPASAALKSANVEIQGQAKATVKGTAMVEIQGGLVKIN